MEDEIHPLSQFRQLLSQFRVRVGLFQHGLTHGDHRRRMQMQRGVRPAPALLNQPQMFQLDEVFVHGFLSVAVRQRREEIALCDQGSAEFPLFLR